MAGVSDLQALFESVDTYVEDLKELGIAGAAGIGANVAWGMASGSLFAAMPESVQGIINTKGVKPLITAVVGVVGGSMVSRYNRTVGLGVGIGLMTSAIMGAIAEFEIPVPGLSGVGEDMFDSFAGATTTLEPVNGFAGATTTLEPVSGFAGAPSMFEDVAGVGRFLS